MITVIGSINVDLIGKVERLPRPAETVPGTTFASAPGGKGANQALAACRAGAAVTMVGAVGDDAFAHEALGALEVAGVDLVSVRHLAGSATGVAMILVDRQGENLIAILPGANGAVGVDAAEAAVAAMDAGDVLMVQQEIPQATTERALRAAAERGITTILNTAPFLETTAHIARLATIVVANETEFDLLMGGTAEREARMARWVEETGTTIVVTLGAEGAKAATPGRSLSVPALLVEPVDTVGAGDTFCGYLAAGLDAGLELEPAMRRAVAAASLACLGVGAQPAIPERNALESVLARA